MNVYLHRIILEHFLLMSSLIVFLRVLPLGIPYGFALKIP
jgi:hypothetical protein